MPRRRERRPKRGTFAHRLNWAWEATGWPVSRISEEVRRTKGGEDLRGTSAVSIGRYLDGEVLPTVDVAVAFAAVLRVSAAWLVTGEGLPDPEALSDHVRPLWRIDGPAGDEHLPETPKERVQAAQSFAEGFAEEPGFVDEWEQLTPTVRVMFGGLLARHMLAARHQGKPWREPFWRGREASKLFRRVAEAAKRLSREKRGREPEPIGSPAFSGVLLVAISHALDNLYDDANPKEDTNDDA